MEQSPILGPQPDQFDEMMVTDPSGGMDPMFNAVTPDIPATASEEEQMEAVTTDALDFVYGEGTEDVIRMMQSMEPFEAAATLAFEILRREKTELEASGERVEPAVFLSPDGAVAPLIGAIFEVAASAGIPGADDPDQQSGAIMNTYAKMGEYIEESGDEVAMNEAGELAAEMALTSPEGEMMDPSMLAEEPVEDVQ